jgi:hypothetical protein
VRRHPKASSAGPSTRQASGLGRSFRGAFETLGASRSAKGSSAPSTLRLALLSLCAAAFLLVPASGALADGEVAVTVAGTGTVTGDSRHEVDFFGGIIEEVTPGQINCNQGGGPVCTSFVNANDVFGNQTVIVTLKGAPGPGLYLASWNVEGASGTSGCGPASACEIQLAGTGGSAGDPKVKAKVTVTFAPLPDPPLVITGPAGPGPVDHTRALQGEVNPGGFKTSDCRFVYGPTTAYGSSVPCQQSAATIGEGSSYVPVTAVTDALEPNTIYHYRLRATALGGTGEGDDLTFTTGPAAADGCANADIRAPQGIQVRLLPACMALEMASPIVKGQQPIRDQGAYQKTSISFDGEHVLFRSNAGFAGTEGVFNIDQGDVYLGSRGENGWTTTPSILRPFGAAAEPVAFAPDLSSWFQIGFADREQAQENINGAYLSSLDRTVTPFSPPLVTTEEPRITGNYAGASADLSHLFIKVGGTGTASSRRYSVDDPMPTPGEGAVGEVARNNTYVATLGEDGQPEPLQLLARDLVGKEWGANCGVRVGGDLNPAVAQGYTEQRVNIQGAISKDGSHVYFSTRPSQPDGAACIRANKMRILERIETSVGPVIHEPVASECGSVPRACPGVATGNITSGSKIVTNLNPASPAGTFAVGMSFIRVDGTGTGGIPANTKIAQILSPTQLELSANATQTAAGVALRANDGEDLFQAASADGSKLYFTSPRQLTTSDLDTGASCGLALNQAAGCDLYLYEKLPGGNHKLVQVSAGDATNPTPGANARVLSAIPGISTDGSHVYFVAQGVLTTVPNALGAVALSGQPNLYLYQRDAANPNGRTAFIGKLVNGDAEQLWGKKIEAFGESSVYPVPAMDAGGKEIGGDGHILLFRSKAQLTAADTDGLRLDVYRYDSQTGSLQCVSCLSGGDSAAADVNAAGNGAGQFGGNPQGPAFASLSRWVSEDGNSVVFETAAPLLPEDANGIQDEYLWREGQLYRLPGKDLDGPPTISADGSSVAIRRDEQLLPQDGDTVADLYVLRSGGGFPIPAVIPPCVEEACQEPFRSQPAGSAAASQTPSAGNLSPSPNCDAPAKRARNLLQQATQLRNQAKRAKAPAQAKRLRSQAKHLSKRANELNRDAKRCRQANRGAGR